MTLDEIITTLQDNADFEEVGSVSKAKSFETAAKRWLITAPSSTSKADASLSMNSQQVYDLMLRARHFISVNDSSNNNRHPRTNYLSVGARW